MSMVYKIGKLEAEMVAASLAPDAKTDHYRCPVCNGGESGEKSFIVFRTDEGYGWKCWRASCDAKGFIRDSMPRSVDRLLRPARAGNIFSGKTRRLSDKEKGYLRHKLGFTQYHINTSGVLMADSGRYVFPVYSPSMAIRGHVLRSWTSSPKAVNRMKANQPCISWYLGHGDLPLIVVEDIPSAVRASLYTNSVALLGTSLTDQYLEEISAQTTRVIWALDNDATTKSTKMAKDSRLLFDESRVVILQQDLKDMSESDLSRLIEDILYGNPQNGNKWRRL
jgi:hypothetical protein